MGARLPFYRQCVRPLARCRAAKVGGHQQCARGCRVLANYKPGHYFANTDNCASHQPSAIQHECMLASFYLSKIIRIVPKVFSVLVLWHQSKQTVIWLDGKLKVQVFHYTIYGVGRQM